MSRTTRLVVRERNAEGDISKDADARERDDDDDPGRGLDESVHRLMILVNESQCHIEMTGKGGIGNRADVKRSS